MIYKHPLFPFVLAFLTLVLAALVGVSLWQRSSVPAASSPASEPSVTSAEYRAAVTETLVKFRAAYDTAPTDSERRLAVESTYNGLLVLRVPSAERELHFALVTSFYLMRDGLYGTTGVFDQGWGRYQELVADNPWLP